MSGQRRAGGTPRAERPRTRASRGWLALLGIAAVALTLAACGSEDEPSAVTIGDAPPAAELTAAERRRFDRAVRAVQRHCRIWARYRERGAVMPAERSSPGIEAAGELIELVRSKPRAPIGRSADVRLRVGDIAESVEGANCDPRLESRLDQGIAEAVTGG